MKNLKYMTIAAFAVISLASCSSNAVETEEAKDSAEATVTSVKYKVDSGKSELHWHGKKLAYGHSGLIDITSGELSMEGDKLTAGKFTVDMSSIRETGEDIDPESAAKLAGHLMNEDFFDAPKFPTSEFEITSAEKQPDGNYKLGGNLTIKGVTKNISFPAKINANEKELTAEAEFTINRIDWNITYGSGITGAIADQAISDDIDFKVKLKADKL